MKTVAVFFGGVSCEHDISVITAVQAMAALDRQKYAVIPVYIHGSGMWFTDPVLQSVDAIKNFDTVAPRLKQVCVLPHEKMLYHLKHGKLKPLAEPDCALLCMHGMNGEDGSLQGLLQLAHIPYTGCGITGSAVGMDKIASKLFFKGIGLKVLPYCVAERREYMTQPVNVLAMAEHSVGYPLMVKPAMLGSSIGISKCNNRDELTRAMETAIRFDRRILLERAEQQFIEINCSAMRQSGGVVRATECEQPVSWRDYLKFEDKYLSGALKGMQGAKRVFPANLSPEVTRAVKDATIKLYKQLNLKGVVRADFIISDDIYINEVNTIPGSLSFYLWEHEKISFEKLLDLIIEEAMDDMSDFLKCNFTFRSNVLDVAGIKTGSKN